MAAGCEPSESGLNTVNKIPAESSELIPNIIHNVYLVYSNNLYFALLALYYKRQAVDIIICYVMSSYALDISWLMQTVFPVTITSNKTSRCDRDQSDFTVPI